MMKSSLRSMLVVFAVACSSAPGSVGSEASKAETESAAQADAGTPQLLPEDLGLTREDVVKKNKETQKRLHEALDRVAKLGIGHAATVNVYEAEWLTFDGSRVREHKEDAKESKTTVLDQATVETWKQWVDKRGLETLFFSSSAGALGEPPDHLDVSWQHGTEAMISNGATIQVSFLREKVISVWLSEAHLADKTEWLVQIDP